MLPHFIGMIHILTKFIVLNVMYFRICVHIDIIYLDDISGELCKTLVLARRRSNISNSGGMACPHISDDKALIYGVGRQVKYIVILCFIE